MPRQLVTARVFFTNHKRCDHTPMADKAISSAQLGRHHIRANALFKHTSCSNLMIREAALHSCLCCLYLCWVE
jgi:hypothetical protein